MTGNNFLVKTVVFKVWYAFLFVFLKICSDIDFLGKKWEEGDFPVNKQDIEKTLNKIAWERYLNCSEFKWPSKQTNQTG